MTILSALKNSTTVRKKIQRVGRGIGSGRGKTCCRGAKGDKARSGYKRRYGYEGGQMPLYKKLPIRGFSNARFRFSVQAVSLRLIELLYDEGEIVNHKTLLEKGILDRTSSKAFKIVGGGQLRKNIRFDVANFSESVRTELTRRSLIIS
jgi:large subunit ribosomal protein L15